MPQEDYYNLLGVDRHAPEREIKRAYYSLARELHPDKAKTPEEARTNNERLAVISKAYNTLKDPVKRADYDKGLTPINAADTQVPPSRPASPPPAAARRDPPTPVEPPAAAAKKPAAASPPGKDGKGKDGAGGAAPAPKMNPSEMANQKVLMAQKAFVKGMELYQNQEFKKAIPFFEAAIKNDADGMPDYHMRLALCLIRSKGSFSRAVAAAERACEMDLYKVEYKLGLGEVYETAGVPSKAKTVYEEVLRWEPDNDKAKMRLKMIHSETSGSGSNFLAKLFPSLFGKK